MAARLSTPTYRRLEVIDPRRAGHRPGTGEREHLREGLLAISEREPAQPRE